MPTVLVLITTALLALAAVSPASAAKAALRVTDAAGRAVALDAPPRRIVVVGHGPFMTLDVLYMFPRRARAWSAGRRRGAATTSSCRWWIPRSRDKAVLRNPGPEQIAALRPDLVLTREPTLDALGKALGQLRIPVVYLGLETPEQFYRDVTNLGTLLGDPERAREINAFYAVARRAHPRGPGGGRARRPTARAAARVHRPRRRRGRARAGARLDADARRSRPRAASPSGSTRPTPTSGWTVTNVEQIARWDPDRIFLVVWYTLDPAQVLATLKADPQWRALRAVRTGALRVFPSDIYGWDTPDPRWLLGMTWLAKTLHPERFARSRRGARRSATSIGTLYGMDESAIDAAHHEQGPAGCPLRRGRRTRPRSAGRGPAVGDRGRAARGRWPSRPRSAATRDRS